MNRNGRSILVTAPLLVVLALAFSAVPLYGGTTGIVSGVIVDSETGERLQGVNLFVEDTKLTTVTDQNGYFVITNVPPGQYRVIANLVGYTEVLVRNVDVSMDVTTPVNISMEMAVAEEDEIVIVELRPMVQHDVVPTRYVIDSKQEKLIGNHPNMLYQTPGIVQTKPGIVVDEDGYPHIRGGRVNQVGYMLDGIPITEPLTNGFGTNITTVGMHEMEMFTGGYRPEYGNAISGVFNQVTKTGRTAPGMTIQTLGGTNSFWGILPEIGGVGSNGMDYYVGAYFWRSEFKGLRYQEAESADMTGKFNYPLNDRNQLTLLTASGQARYSFPTVNSLTYGTSGLQPTELRHDYQGQSHLLAAMTWNHTIDSSSFVTVRPYYFKTTWNMEALSDEIGFWWDAGTTSKGLQLDYTNQISPKHLLKAGTVRIASDNRYWANVPSYSEWGLGDYEYTANTDTVQTGLYIQDQMRLDDRWGAEVGVRYDHMNYKRELDPNSSESQLSPRLGLSYVLDPMTNLRFSYGKMIQFVYTQAIERNYLDPDAIWGQIYYGAGTGNLRPERSTQYDIGIERQVSDHYTFQATPFYRKYVDLLQSTLLDPENPDFSPIIFDNLGNGVSRGIEFLLRKRPVGNWSGWLSYTYSKARAENNNDREMHTPGQLYYVDWDQRHTASVVANYNANKWNYSIVGSYGSGLPYNLSGEDRNSRRTSSHAVVNLNISREITGGWLPRGVMQFSVANLFNTGAALKTGETGDPIVRVTPRFVHTSYTRHF